MFEFQATASEIRDLADNIGCTPFQAKQMMYREARLRYGLELMERVSQIGDNESLVEAVMFLLQREVEKNSQDSTKV